MCRYGTGIPRFSKRIYPRNRCFRKGAGVVLSNEGEERLVAYVNRQMNAAERSYFTTFFTRYAQGIPLQDQIAKSTVKAFLKEIIIRHGMSTIRIIID